MKARVYLRVGKGKRGPRVAASAKPNLHPLEDGSGRNAKIVPTVAFGVDLDIPDELFQQAETVVAELQISGDKAKIAASVKTT